MAVAAADADATAACDGADLRGGEDLRSCGGVALGKLEEVSFDDRTIDIKKRGDAAGEHPEAIFAHRLIETDVQANALVRIGEWVADRRIDLDGEYRAAQPLALSDRQIKQVMAARVPIPARGRFLAALANQLWSRNTDAAVEVALRNVFNRMDGQMKQW